MGATFHLNTLHHFMFCLMFLWSIDISCFIFITAADYTESVDYSEVVNYGDAVIYIEADESVKCVIQQTELNCLYGLKWLNIVDGEIYS